MAFDSTARRASGYISITSPETLFEADTLQCIHGGHPFVVKPGSGIFRGFCRNCMGYTCGSAQHDLCTGPFEKKLDLYEKGLLIELK